MPPIHTLTRREYLEGGIDQCVPSLTFTALVTRWACVFEWRAWPPAGPTTVWLARGAPRRWFDAAAGGFAALRVPTCVGTVSFSAATTAAGAGACNVTVVPPPFAQPPGADPPPALIVIRVRALAPGQVMRGAALSSQAPPGLTLVSWNATQESVTVALPTPLRGEVTFGVLCNFTA